MGHVITFLNMKGGVGAKRLFAKRLGIISFPVVKWYHLDSNRIKQKNALKTYK
jgi:hypothetical protein